VVRKAAGHIGCARIPRNVLAEHIPRKAQGMELFWDAIGCVIADQHRVAAAL
jgi:hypothetical protein